MKSKVLFLCTGNYYRSRFAEIYFNHHSPALELNWEAFSRGYRAANSKNVGPISIYTKEALAQREISDYDRDRFPIQLTEEDLKIADLIIAVKEKEHRPFTQEMFPEWENKIVFWHIDDIDAALPKDAIPLLEDKVKSLMTGLASQK